VTGRASTTRTPLIRARAPLRISFAGGGTDLSPFAEDHGGLVLNATINRYAYATLRFPEEQGVMVTSLDYRDRAHYPPDEPFILDGKFDLVKACLQRLHATPEQGGIELYLETEAPPGSGLGSSSALVVAVVGALRTWRHMGLDAYEIAHLAWEIERQDVGVPGGLQDQYAAAFGGFNFIEFRGHGEVVVNPLRIDPRVIRELQYNLLLFYTGRPRESMHMIERQIAGYVAGQAGVVDATMRIKELTVAAKDAILTARLDDLGEILDEEWTQKRRTAEGVSTPHIEEMYDEARKLGALGGKVSGAGGGGYMFLYCPFDRKPAISARLVELGAELVPMAFEPEGLHCWSW
jgi:D-glycero-alpha-D-manno-heptose-7-phosphate kinase